MAASYKRVEIVGNVWFDKEQDRTYRSIMANGEQTHVFNFSVRVSTRVRDKDGNWSNGDTIWTECNAWGSLAENLYNSWNSGDRVWVVGNARFKPGYKNRDGVEMPAGETVTVEKAGHDCTFNTSKQESNRKDDGEQPAKPAAKPAAAKPAAAKPEPKKEDPFDDLVLDDTDSFDIDMPF